MKLKLSILALVLFSFASFAVAEECPSASSVKQAALSMAVPANEMPGYWLASSQLGAINNGWTSIVGYISAPNQFHAIKAGNDLLQTKSLNSGFMTSSDNGDPVCIYYMNQSEKIAIIATKFNMVRARSMLKSLI